jgi:hypothetical protein
MRIAACRLANLNGKLVLLKLDIIKKKANQKNEQDEKRDGRGIVLEPDLKGGSIACFPA